MKASEVNGSVKAQLVNKSTSMSEYLVVLHRGEEEGLISKLRGDITNLVTFCDNKFKFDDTIERHYGGCVEICWIYDNKNTLTGIVSTILCLSEKKPSKYSKRAYKVTVYTD